jgi:hypothetical protein
LRNITVRVGELVAHLVSDPNNYILTAANVRTSAFGDHMTSLSFYGTDLALASLFRDNLEIFNPFMCGIRMVPSRDERKKEILRISTDGSITASFSTGSAREIVKLLNYIFENGFFVDDRAKRRLVNDAYDDAEGTLGK